MRSGGLAHEVREWNPCRTPRTVIAADSAAETRSQGLPRKLLATQDQAMVL